MTLSSIADLARSIATQNQTKLLKTRQAQLTQEITTGQVADPTRALGGDTRVLSHLSRALEIVQGYTKASKEIAQMAQSAETTLATIYASSEELMETLITAPQSRLAVAGDLANREAKAAIETVFSTMNSEVAGRFLFSGAATATPPLTDAQTFMNELDTALGGLTTVSDVARAIDDFFSPGGTFETSIYQGSTTNVQSMMISENETVDLSQRADDPRLQNLLRAAAYAYAAGKGVTGLNREQKSDIMSMGRSITLNSQEGLIDMRSEVGFMQERIENSIVRLSAESMELEKSRGELLGVDSFEVATRLKDVNSRLEMVYAATARISQLSFLEYMR